MRTNKVWFSRWNTIVGICIILLLSCTNTNISQEFKDLPQETKTLVIIPGVGCDACIADGLWTISMHKQYFLEAQKEVLVVFTSIQSKKMLNRILVDFNISDINMYVDIDNEYVIPEYSKYPVVCYIKNGKISKYEVQSPNGVPAMDNLVKLLRENQK